jgi:hypothetical protein
MEMDHAAWHSASPLQALSRLRVTAACPRLCRLGAPNYPDLVEVVAVSLAAAALFAYPLSIPGLHQDHHPALAERF